MPTAWGQLGRAARNYSRESASRMTDDEGNETHDPEALERTDVAEAAAGGALAAAPALADLLVQGSGVAFALTDGDHRSPGSKRFCDAVDHLVWIGDMVERR